ncbi:MAG: acetate/propionate family kinase [Planctomycetota bacterium]|jgi:acetate kinase|nr:acetate/propionate family kinase [Planctomycetota bacterium]MEC7716374.1 acetate/propionate family kinase [Planctomycetota bacterium]MEC8410065.1 acetate/propionate family kinase [Planctomycetota bacterium]MEC8592273.1 acetate/propionate family kinase [Planctomycetota bacterium]MEC8862349.1 acetate/propionate family kinase [Planctomycetota bacterium]
MKVLVANLGSTSFKYRLFDMDNEEQLARGGIDRIGSAESYCFVEIGSEQVELSVHVPDHAEAVRRCLEQLTNPDTGCLNDASEVSAIGFKAVHGGKISGVQRIDAEVLTEMEKMNAVAPAHNPPYIAAMRQLAEKLPEIPLVAAFETGFHQTISDAQKFYGVPFEWAEDYHIKRWGFHGASHRYIGQRLAEVTGREDMRAISCHLGGSSSLCAIRGRESIGTTMGMSPQTGLLHNNRCGDFDPFAIPVVMEATGKSLEEVLVDLASQSGLLGLSGISGDVRDLEKAAGEGHERAQLALDVFVTEIRRHLGGLMVALGGLDAIVFTGGIGENGQQIRAGVCQGLEEFGVVLDPDKNATARGETQLEAAASRVQLWTIPTNEELVVARQSRALLEGS